MRPFYESSAPKKFEAKDHNTGLWYDKFVNCWEGNSWTEAKANKLTWIQTVAGTVGSKTLIEEFANRQRQLVARSGGVSLILKTESRFATGLGRKHPIENGFAWHHTLGTPYLPGSSIKGLIRNWAEEWEGRNKPDVNAILGGPGSVGRVLLLDALPLSPPQLEADVMTPHYGDYYQSSDNNVVAPGDWLSPVPIPFLVVAAGASFQFAIVPNTAADQPLLETVQSWLIQSLQWLGAGAKTAVGYGRFVRDEAAEQKLKQAEEDRQKKAAEVEAKQQAQAARMQGLSPELQALVQRADAEQWEVSPGAFVPEITKFLAETPSLSADAIEWIKTHCVEKHWKGIWAIAASSQSSKKFKPNQIDLVRKLQAMRPK